MKILYCDVLANTINPSASLSPSLISEVSEHTCFYGPGFVDQTTLDTGILRFEETHGPFDLVFLGPNIPITAPSTDYSNEIAYLKKYTSCKSKKSNLNAFFHDVVGNLQAMIAEIKVLNLLNYDYYATSPEQISRLLDTDVFILAPGANFVQSMSALPSWAWQEKHFLSKSERLSDVWFDFLVANQNKVINGTHFVSNDEIWNFPWANRSKDFIVPGVNYYMRGVIRDKLVALGVRPRDKILFNIFKLASKLKVPTFSNPHLLSLYHKSYQNSIRDCQVAFTARGGFGIPVRKFFEIPAFGTLMACIPPNGFSDLGFEDGHNYLAINLDHLDDLIRKIQVEQEWAENIANNGRELIKTKHSINARAHQIRKCLKLICEKRYKGSTWCGGQFRLVE